jgi:hypothetical protein
MLLRIRRFISIYLTARTLSLMLCALLAGVHSLAVKRQGDSGSLDQAL